MNYLKPITAVLGGICVGYAALNLLAAPYADKRLNPVSASPPYSISATADSLHGTLAIADMHADMLLWSRNHYKRSSRGHVDLPRLRDGNVALQVFSVVTKSPFGQNYESNSSDSDRITFLAIAQAWPVETWGSLMDRALYQAEQLHKLSRESHNSLQVVKTRDDLDELLNRRSEAEPVAGGILAMEGLHPIEGDTAKIRTLYEAGFRMMALTHMFDNELAGAAHGMRRDGLSEKGVDAIRMIENLGVVVDLAHASPSTIDDVLDVAARPVVVSHTGLQGACQGTRNLSDDQATRIADNGGLIGIGFWPGAVCGSDVDAIVRSIRYAIELVGAEHVALGSDFDGTVTTPFDASGLPLLTEALIADGLRTEQIEAIMGGNVVDLLLQILPEAVQSPKRLPRVRDLPGE